MTVPALPPTGFQGTPATCPFDGYRSGPQQRACIVLKKWYYGQKGVRNGEEGLIARNSFFGGMRYLGGAYFHSKVYELG